MHVLYVHQDYPAQFGHIAHHLVSLGSRCTFLTRAAGGAEGGIDRIQYRLAGQATREGHYCARGFENTVWQCDAVYKALKKRPDVKPDLIVGHSGFGTTLFLPELYPDVPLVNYFEYYFHPSDPKYGFEFRRDLGWDVPEMKHIRNRCRNAMMLLDLQNCTLAYAPTEFQKSTFPIEYHGKMQVVFDGVDRTIYHGYGENLRPLARKRGVRIGGKTIPPGTRIVTYVSRGFESMRGFDIFMKAARRIAELYPNVAFVVVGSDRITYGHDKTFLGPDKTFVQWVLEQEQFDLSRFLFLGRLSPVSLGRLLAATDLHIYLTVPFTLSWSMMDAMSCGAVVLGSATPPVQEMIREGENGLLADFFDWEQIAQRAVQVLQDPAAFRPLGRAAERRIELMYSVEAVIPQMLRMYDSVANRAQTPAAVGVP